MLVFSQFTMMLDILEDFLELRGLSYSRLDGAMAFSERQRQVAKLSVSTEAAYPGFPLHMWGSLGTRLCHL